ncbi:FRG domain-containing protein [Pontibacter diazotrophicus]|uniref:FRG domain-containing protein n=1 Tax=Pontibacter diazotrophicus TaxID=1400979 RepID=A0A3D8KZI0_9BACT|nr:FRG domain-containing protein [Pontibacter diazotrophicus]RDV10357.1 FRG domain-containing protein [Pontibacter diazotrophicus]
MDRDQLTNSPVIKTIDFNSARDFLEVLRRSNPLWKGKTDIDNRWVFRGQGDAKWKLQPSAFRPQERGKKTLRDKYIALLQRQYRNSNTDWLKWVGLQAEAPQGVTAAEWQDRVGKTAIQALAHAKVVRDFVLLADSAGHRVRHPKILWHLEDDQGSSLNKLFNGTTKMHPLFAIAQHHGVPTGLLDWTYNPLVAAYFAAEKPQGKEIAVWALNLDIVVKPDIYLRRLTVPPQKIPFLDAQEGLFVWCPQAYLIHLREGCFPTLESMVELSAQDLKLDMLPGPFLYKLTLPTSEAIDILRLLWREKVSPAHLMPTFDNITRALEMQIELSPDLYGLRDLFIN